MSTRISNAFEQSEKALLSIYFTAGYPELGSTVRIAECLQREGVGLLEIGFPFSDPLADGPTIQQSSEVALKNGMTLDLLFSELKDLRKRVQIPVLLMGYLNPVLQYGMEKFCAAAAAVGVDGVILPDLPFDEFESQYRKLFEKYGLSVVFLITPETTNERIRKVDELSQGFIYALSASSITGTALSVDAARDAYLTRVKGLKLRNPVVVGFGVHDQLSFEQCARYANGVIIGSAFVRALGNTTKSIEDRIGDFIGGIRS